MNSGIRALPGVCEGGPEASSLVLAVKNESHMAVTLDKGAPLALCAGTIEGRDLKNYVVLLREEAGDMPRQGRTLGAAARVRT